MSATNESSSNESTAKRKKRVCIRGKKTFQESWLQNEKYKGWLAKSNDPLKSRYIACAKEFNTGTSELDKHANGTDTEPSQSFTILLTILFSNVEPFQSQTNILFYIFDKYFVLLLNMDENFENFLKSRDIEEDTIEYLRTEKIDCKVIDVMSDEDLAKIFPVYGDRIAISNYCKNAVSSCSSRKQSLLDRLRKKINQKRKKKNVLSSSDEENEAFPKKLNMDKKMSVAMKKQHNRFIEIGWLHSEDSGNNFKQVRTRSGGGTRKVNVAQSFKKEDLLKIAIELFFPNGISSKGKISDFKTDVFDFGGNQLNDHYNVEEMYTVTGLTRLRIYLSTQRIIGQVNENIHAIEPRTYPKQKCETLTSGAYEYESYCANIAIGNPYEERLTNERVIDENECYNVEEFLVLPTPSENTASDFLLALELQQVEDANNSILPIEKNSVSDGSIAKLTLHRGHIFEELIDIYTSLDISTQIDIQIVLPNGNEEAAVDFGGVFRDALSEFWTTITIKKGRRAKNFTPTEVEILIVEVENRRNILFGPLKGPSLTQYHRDRAWDQVLSHVNSVAPCVRSVGELKKKFKDLKSRTKSRANALLRESRKTGGGENDAAPLNAFEEKMLAFVGKESVEGIRGEVSTPLLSVNSAPSCFAAATYSFPATISSNPVSTSYPAATTSYPTATTSYPTATTSNPAATTACEDSSPPSTEKKFFKEICTR
ncbi:hypothetical protein TcasGA2_TC031761 [Tribolium castaneum]|uniref:Regulatory protein zeste n=1 Tax=Tribolium castaneum TaxID=7070 RepID=A0A139W9K6_TRICA|nr:hypothetical protein TcasGA2_TC031761 [Tribolium castaneum]